MQLKRPLALAATMSLATALAACGGSGDDDNDAAEDPSSGFVDAGDAGAGKEEREGPAPEIEGAQEGGTIDVISASTLETMDPTESYYVVPTSILSGMLTRSLTQYVYKDGAMVLVPDLATTLGEPNEDYTEWTFEIREGIKWEDGSPMTMDDIVFGIKRSFDRDTFPEGPTYSNDYFIDGDKYKGPYTDKGKEYNGVTVNGQTLTIKMSKPFPDMPYWGAFPAIGPIPNDAAVDPADYALHPMSTGPYMIEEYTPNQSLHLVRNENWDPATDPGRHAYVDEYKMEFGIGNQSIVDTRILSDNEEAATTLTTDNVLQADLAKAQQQDKVVIGGYPLTQFWMPDYRKITDKNIRMALGYAYPYADAWVAGGDIVGTTRIPGTMVMPPGVPGRNDPPYDVLGNEGIKSDPAKAKQLLEEAGELGYEIRFLYITDDPDNVKVKDVVVDALEKAGFKATPVASTLETYSSLRADPATDINLRTGGWISDWPSGSSWIPPVFETGGGFDYAQYSEPAVDKEIDQIQRMPIEDQPDAWAALEKKIMEEDYPVIVTGYGSVALLKGEAIQNFEIDTIFGTPTWKDLWIQQ